MENIKLTGDYTLGVHVIDNDFTKVIQVWIFDESKKFKFKQKLVEVDLKSEEIDVGEMICTEFNPEEFEVYVYADEETDDVHTNMFRIKMNPKL